MKTKLKVELNQSAVSNHAPDREEDGVGGRAGRDQSENRQ